MVHHLLGADVGATSDANAAIAGHFLLSAGRDEDVIGSVGHAVLTPAGRDILTADSGTISVDLRDGARTLHYLPRRHGTFRSYITEDPIWYGDIQYLDEDGEEYGKAPAAMSWSAYVPMRIKLIPASDAHRRVVSFTWSYTVRRTVNLVATGSLLMSSDDPNLVDTPAAVVVQVANGVPNERLTFQLGGGGEWHPNLLTTRLNDEAVCLRSVPIPKLEPGLYTLAVVGAVSGTDTIVIAVEQAPLDSSEEVDAEDLAYLPAPTAPGRWELVDRYDESIRYVFPRNPASWTNPHTPNQFVHDAAVSPKGQILTWQAARRAYPMEFTGVLLSQEEYEDLQFWADRRRRFWLIDHRNRTWVVTFEHLDARPRIVPNRPWVHDYTMKAVVFRRAS